jgi:hypothetical protein
VARKGVARPIILYSPSDALTDVALGVGGLIQVLAPEAIHVSMSTIQSGTLPEPVRAAPACWAGLYEAGRKAGHDEAMTPPEPPPSPEP